MTAAALFAPSPRWGEGFLPRSCARSMRKSHGGKGEGGQALENCNRQFPLTRIEATLRLQRDFSPLGRGLVSSELHSHGR